MKWFYNLKIRAKLLSGFIIVAVIAVIIGAIGIINLLAINKNYTQTFNENAKPLANIGRAATEFQRIRLNARNIMIDANVNNRKGYLTKIAGFYEDINQNMVQYAKSISSEEERGYYQKYLSLMEKYKPLLEKAINLALAGQTAPAINLMLQQIDPVAREIDAAITQMFDVNVKQGDANAARNAQQANQTFFFMIAVILIALAVSIGLGIFIARIINNPVQKLVQAAERLSLGDVNIEMAADTRDEIGQLMTAFAKMIDNIREQAKTAESISSGDLTVDVNPRSDQDVLGMSIREVVETLRNLIVAMDNMSRQHDAGDIDVFVPEDKFRGAYQLMAKGVNNMVKDYITLNQKAMACIAEFGQGNFGAQIEKFPGKKAFINENIEAMRHNLKNVNDAINKLIVACQDGRLNEKANAQAFSGDWAVLINGLNGLIEAIIEPIQESAAVLEEVSQGNLQVTVQGDYKGDHAAMKNALNNTIASLNEVLGEISNAAEQVAVGAQHVSQSSQVLSQGSTEQASSLEEITASVTQVAAQTKQNAVNANQANDLAMAAKDSAIAGNQEMKGMLQAMEEINESSANISKIIKVIDEIAFQTNILALNAAVEAARAGQHGKGFAVVAEEVRNLAARSANAAKETTVMIEGSIRKVEAGTKIAHETANALNKIVESVGGATNLVADIAAASNQQATAISQVNQGIEQVSQVTQSNTATSEQSAAASQELSSQAQVLKSMVARFKLNENGAALSQLQSLSPDVLKAIGAMVSRKNGDGAASFSPQPEAAASSQSKLKIRLDGPDFGKY